MVISTNHRGYVITTEDGSAFQLTIETLEPKAVTEGLRVHVFAPDRREDWGLGTVILVDDLVEETGEVLSSNIPTIRLDSGREVTGLECWWRAEVRPKQGAGV